MASPSDTVELPTATTGKTFRLPWDLEWLNAAAPRSMPFRATPVSSSCSMHTDSCAPDFVIVGTGNAASTSLYASVMQHPQLVPARHKEVNFLGLHSHFLDRHEYSARLLPASGRLRHGELLGEASPYYLANPVAPAQLRYLAPRAKIIIMLRAPPDHCWSASTANVRAAWSRDGSSAPCRLVERSPPRVLAHYHPCDTAHYTDALERWLHHVPTEWMLVLLFERFVEDPGRELQVRAERALNARHLYRLRQSTDRAFDSCVDRPRGASSASQPSISSPQTPHPMSRR